MNAVLAYNWIAVIAGVCLLVISVVMWMYQRFDDEYSVQPIAIALIVAVSLLTVACIGTLAEFQTGCCKPEQVCKEAPP